MRSSFEEDHFFDNLANKMRVVQIYTIIAGASVAVLNSHQKAVPLSQITEADCADVYKFEIDDAMLN